MITYNELSWVLKVAVVASWIGLIFFGGTFILGMISGIFGS